MFQIDDRHVSFAILVAAVFTAATNGASVDLKAQKSLGGIKFIMDTPGSTGNANNTLAIQMQQCDDNATWANWPATVGFGVQTGSGAGAIGGGGAFNQVGYNAAAHGEINALVSDLQRYQRAVVTPAGTTPSYIVNISAVAYKQA